MIAALGYAKWIGGGLIVAALLIGGWWLKGRVARAAQADELEMALALETKAREKADADRVTMGLQLSDAEAALLMKTKVITKEVVRHVKDNRDCDLGPDIVRMLSDARGTAVPAAADPAAHPAP